MDTIGFIQSECGKEKIRVDTTTSFVLFFKKASLEAIEAVHSCLSQLTYFAYTWDDVIVVSPDPRQSAKQIGDAIQASRMHMPKDTVLSYAEYDANFKPP